MTQQDIFEKVESASQSKGTRASWRGTLQLSAFGITDATFHLRAGKAKGENKPINVTKLDSETGKPVKALEVPVLYRYRVVEGQRQDVQEIPYEEAKEHVRYVGAEDPGWLISARNEKRYFDAEALETKGIFIQVPASRVIDKEGQEEIEPFDRTDKLEFTETDIVPLSRISEYKMKEVYMLSADTDKKVREQPKRVRDLARLLFDKGSALVTFFSWGRGYNYFSAVVFPYERKADGKLWLLMGMSEGILQLDPTWALESETTTEKAPELVVASPPKKKASVKISK